MNDRELLERAAKAAGYKLAKWRHVTPFLDVFEGLKLAGAGDDLHDEWNPLEDDGDALRLATDLELNVFHAAGNAYAMQSEDDGHQCVSYRDAGGKHAATRRAIVRAAAEMEKNHD